MRFFLDEGVEARHGSFLNARGHDATRIASDHPASLPDADALAIAHREQRILITNEKDFGELVFQQRLPHAGVILFRPPSDVTIQQKTALLDHLLRSRQDELCRFLIVTPRQVRIR